MRKLKKLLSVLVVMLLSFVVVSCGAVPQSDISNSSISKVEDEDALIESSASSEDESNSGVSSDGENTSSNDESEIHNVTGELKVHFIDVGQADSILIQQGDENMLIDAGNNADEDTLKSYLNNLGVTEFKYVVGTHAHEDHIGSLDYIMNSFKVGKIYFPKATATTKTFENLVKAVQNKGMQFTAPTVGETFNLGEAKCTILAPNGSTYEDVNNYSIVIKIEYGNNIIFSIGPSGGNEGSYVDVT